MKITTLLLIVTLLQVSAASRAQKISLSESRAPLTKVLREIRSQSGFNLVYTEEMLKDAKAVSIRVKDAEMREVLDEVFREQPLSYTIVNNAIVLKEKETSLLDRIRAAWVAVDVNGRVVDEQGQPLPGATVKVKDGSQATTTDARGEFTLRQVQPDATLVVSFIGFQQLEVKASANMGNIVMKVAESQLDQVQVIAYGKTSQRLSTGNVTTIKAEDIEKQPVTNPLLALQGRVPGLFVEQSTGLPGSGVKVRIQGQNSMTKGNDPLYVIDGVPYTSQLLPNVSSILGSSGGLGNVAGNPLTFINPQDIESISVLKDADATAIYGSRAANGAILITTKKGKAGDTRVSFNLQNGWGKVARKMDLLNAQQYLAMRHEALKNDGIATPGPNDFDLNGTWDTTRTTDWQKELIGRSAQYMDYQGGISGGSENIQYNVGTSYHRETSVFPGDYSDRRAAVSFSLSSASKNKKFHFQFSGNYMADNNQLPDHDFTYDALQLVPVGPQLYNSDGSLNWVPNQFGSSTWNNPLKYTLEKNTNKTTNMVASALVKYNIFKGLNVSSNFGYTNLQSNETKIFPLKSLMPEQRLSSSPSAQFSENNINSWIIEPQISYDKMLGPGKFDALLGSTFQQSNSRGQILTADGFSNDLLIQDINSAGKITATSATQLVYKYNAVFGRLNYNIGDKYILNLTARRDGSSRFGSEDQVHNFGSIAGAWIFSNESIFKQALPFVSFGKLRVSFGTTGNDQISDYQFLSLYGVVRADNTYLGGTGLEPKGLSNPYLQWEETRKLQFGLDLGFLQDRILLNANVYRNRSSNQLLDYALPTLAGFDRIARNFPATVQNSGLELTLNTINLRTNKFVWTTGINFTLSKNKLISFPNFNESSYTADYVIGQPITTIKTFDLIGVNSKTGVYEYKDQNGNVTSNPSNPTDKTILVNLAPTFYGGISNSLHYKSFDLDFLFQFVKQKAQNMSFGGVLPPGTMTAALGNQPITVLNRWQKDNDNDNDNAAVQRYNSNFALFSSHFLVSQSNQAYVDASYIRLKNLSLSWILPSKLQTKLNLQNAKVFFHGQNLLTITNYKGLDPENKSTTALPPLKVYSFGLQFSL